MSGSAIFSPRGDSSVVVSSDSRLAMYNIANSKNSAPVMFSEKNHLSSGYRSAAWSNPLAPISSNTASKSLLAFGSENGSIVVWDVSRAEVYTRFGGNSNNSSSNGKGANSSSSKNDKEASSNAIPPHTTPVISVVWSSVDNDFINLYSTAEGSGKVLEWRLGTSQATKASSSSAPVRSINVNKKGLSRLAITNDGTTLFAGNTDISVVDIESGKAIANLQGHSLPISGLTISNDDNVLVSSSDERNIHLWDMQDPTTSSLVNDSSSSGNNSSVPPTVVLLLPAHPIANTLQVSYVGKNQYHVAVAAENGKAYIFRYKRSSKSDGKKTRPPISPSTTILAASDSKKGLNADPNAVLAVQVSTYATRGEQKPAVGYAPLLTVAVGPLARPSFFSPSYLVDSTDASQLQETVVLSLSPGGAAAKLSESASSDDSDSDSSTNTAKAGGVATSSKHRDANTTRETVAEARGAVAARSMSTTEQGLGLPLGGVAKKRGRSASQDQPDALDMPSSTREEGDEEEGELLFGTLGQRLRSVVHSLRNPAVSSLEGALSPDLMPTPADDEDGADEEEAAFVGKEDAAKEGAIDGSVAVALTQALQSRDHHQVEQLLCISDKRIVARTVQQLPIQVVLPLLNSLVTALQSKGSRAAVLLVWVRDILRFKLGYLLSSPGLIVGIEKLYQLVDARVAVFKKLVRLSGRVDLLLDSISDDATSFKVPGSVRTQARNMTLGVVSKDKKSTRRARLAVAEEDLLQEELEEEDDEEDEDDEDIDDEDEEEEEEEDEEEDDDEDMEEDDEEDDEDDD